MRQTVAFTPHLCHFLETSGWPLYNTEYLNTLTLLGLTEQGSSYVPKGIRCTWQVSVHIQTPSTMLISVIALEICQVKENMHRNATNALV